jgi:hypothetical protein
MVHKSYTLNFCLEEWFINLLIHAYQYTEGKGPRTGGQVQPQTLKGSVTGNTDLDNYILSSRVAPDTTDADVHALCTKPAVLKMEGFP